MYHGAGKGRKENQDLVCNQEAGHYTINFLKIFKIQHDKSCNNLLI
jgi:hypothetical protein